MEFAEITEDPFTNNTVNYFLVLDFFYRNIPNPSGTGITTASSLNLTDPGGNHVGYGWFAWTQDYEVTGSLSDEAYAHSFAHQRMWTLVPPKFTISQFVQCIGFWLLPKEVEQFILGRLSLKGGD